MNQTTSLPPLSPLFSPRPAEGDRHSATAPSHQAAADALQSRFGLRVASRLTEQSRRLDPEISERLRYAREQALERARSTRTSGASGRLGNTSAGAVMLGRSPERRTGGSWWFKLASVLPVFALVGGLVLIQRWQDNAQVSVAAEIDAALLSDDLPPTAYSDAGFAEFLKNPGQ